MDLQNYVDFNWSTGKGSENISKTDRLGFCRKEEWFVTVGIMNENVLKK